MEDLVGHSQRPGHVVVEVAEGEGPLHRLGLGAIPPGDQQAPAGERVAVVDSGQQGEAGRPGQRLAGQHERHRRAVVRQAVEDGQGGLDVGGDSDVVVAAVAAGELALQRGAVVGVVVGHDDGGARRVGHGRGR